jgi:hypothetical protein
MTSPMSSGSGFWHAAIQLPGGVHGELPRGRTLAAPIAAHLDLRVAHLPHVKVLAHLLADRLNYYV